MSARPVARSAAATPVATEAALANSECSHGSCHELSGYGVENTSRQPVALTATRRPSVDPVARCRGRSGRRAPHRSPGRPGGRSSACCADPGWPARCAGPGRAAGCRRHGCRPGRTSRSRSLMTLSPVRTGSGVRWVLVCDAVAAGRARVRRRRCRRSRKLNAGSRPSARRRASPAATTLVTARPPSPATTVLILVGRAGERAADVGGDDAAGAGCEGPLEHDDVLGAGERRADVVGRERPVHRQRDHDRRACRTRRRRP